MSSPPRPILNAYIILQVNIRQDAHVLAYLDGYDLIPLEIYRIQQPCLRVRKAGPNALPATRNNAGGNSQPNSTSTTIQRSAPGSRVTHERKVVWFFEKKKKNRVEPDRTDSILFFVTRGFQ